MKRLLLLIILCIVISLSVTAQRLSNERLYLKQGVANSFFEAILPLFNSQVLIESGDKTFNLEEKSTRRLLTPTLDTVWTRTVFPFAGWQGLLQLPNGDCIGLGLIQNPPYAGTGSGSQSGQDAFLEKITVGGQTRWSHYFDFNRSAEGGVGLTISSSQQILSTVWTSTVGRNQTYLLITDSVGQEIRRIPYGWGGNEYISHTQTSATGRVLLAGHTFWGGTPPAQLKLLLLNQRGDSVRGRLLAPLGTTTDTRTLDIQNGLLPLADGGWLLTGYRDTTARQVPDQPFLLLLDSLLQPRWVRRYQAPANADVVYGGTCELTDGSVLVLAWQRQPRTTGFTLHRYSATGQLMHIYPFTSAVAGLAVAPYLLAPAPNGRTLFVAGYATPTLTSQQSYVATIDLQTLPGAVILSAPMPVQSAPPTVLFDFYPNPASSDVTVRYALPIGSAETTLCLYNSTGQLVRRQTLVGRSGEARVTVAGLRTGLYLAALVADGRVLASRRLAVAAQ